MIVNGSFFGKRRTQLSLALGIVLVICVPIARSQDHAIGNGVFGSGGGTVEGDGLRLIGTAGQPLVGTVSNASHTLLSGVGHEIPGIRWTDVSAEVEQVSSVPREFRLDQNYPNPFNPTTNIQFAIRTRSQVTLTLYNVLGQTVATLAEGDLAAGEYEVSLDASDLPSGLYLYRLRAGTFVESRKMILLK